MAKTGFLVVAQDRGHQGNQEIREIFDAFAEDYPASLLLIGPDSQGIECGYRAYIEQAYDNLSRQDASEVVAIPLFVSDGDFLLQKFKPEIERAGNSALSGWTPALSESYLAEEILLDQIRDAGGAEGTGRLVVLAAGAEDQQSLDAVAADVADMARRLKPLAGFTEVVPLVVSDDDFSENPPVNNEFEMRAAIESLAEGGQVVIIAPFFLEEKFSGHMSAWRRLKRKFAAPGLALAPSIMPNRTVLTWLRQMANRYLPPPQQKVGLIIMPHGSTMPYNEGIKAALEPVTKNYPTAYAFGMADRVSIAEAVAELERRGITHAIFIRLFGLSRHFKAASDYILGLSNSLPPHAFHGPVPERIRTSLDIRTFGGYEETPLIAEVWRDRILEVSETPENETVIFLAHGAYSDRTNQERLAGIEKNIALVKELLPVEFREIRAMALREDWLEQREQSLNEIRDFIEQESETGRVIIISNRLYGSGAYAQYLEGLDYVMNGQGIVPHPNLVRWVEEMVDETLAHWRDGGR